MKPELKRITYLVIALLIASYTITHGQCSEFYGITALGGEYNNGVIYKTDTNGNYAVVHNFEIIPRGAQPYSDVCKATNGKFYGMTSKGGAYNMGVLFEWDPVTNDYVKKLDFNGTEKGSIPKGSLIQAANGKLYGMTTLGGANNMGVLFEFDIETGTYVKKFDFDSITSGSHPNGSLLQVSDGKLYGMTLDGGVNNIGVLFSWDPVTAIYTKKLDFSGIDNGSNPYGSLIQADNNTLYGMTSSGGSYADGVLFKWNIVLDSCIKKVDFNATEKGKNPRGSLLLADNGKLYGMTVSGGTNNDGVIFEFDPLSDIFIKQFDFFDRFYGKNPYGSLVQASNGKLYGMTSYGGMYGFSSSHGVQGIGVIFEWDPESKNFDKMIDFWGNEGSCPHGSFVHEGNGKLLGISRGGGIYGCGELFEYDPSENISTIKIEFKNTGDYNQMGSLCPANNGKIYGMFSGAGITRHGALFELDPVTGIYSKKIDFNGKENGSYPLSYSVEGCGLTQADNGKIYGITRTGGEYGEGVLFEWDPESEVYTKKIDFDNAAKGGNPFGSLVKAKNGKLYGMTSSGGLYNYGILFEWDPVTDSFIKKLDFNGSNGKEPTSSLALASNGKLYGMTTYGGENGGGVLFEWDPAKDTYTKKLDFNSSKLKYPEITLVQAYNGKFYGTGWNHDDGEILFEFDPTTTYFTVKYSFRNKEIDGISPTNCLLLAQNGKLYGVTKSGGQNGCGVFYEFDAATNSYSKKFDFKATHGIRPASNLIEIVNPICSHVEACENYTSPSGRYVWITSGSYNDTIPGSMGGDSIITIYLSIKKRSSETFNYITCNSYVSPSGKIWTSSGKYTDTIPNSVGCDSVITINLTVNHSTSSIINSTACNGYFSPSGRYTWTSDGTYLDTIPNSAGCDSIITVNLTIGRSTSFIQQSACDTYTSPSGRYTWTSSGTYLDTIPNAAGCDSLITIDLQIDHMDTTVIQDRTLLISNDINASHQWIDCGNGNTLIEGGTFLTYTAVKNGHYAVIVSQGACVDTSSCYAITVTGITELSDNNITLYPNPTNGSFTIDLGRVCAEAVVYITASDGQIIQRKNARNTRIVELDLAAPPGVYMVNVRAGNEAANYKVVKE